MTFASVIFPAGAVVAGAVVAGAVVAGALLLAGLGLLDMALAVTAGVGAVASGGDALQLAKVAVVAIAIKQTIKRFGRIAEKSILKNPSIRGQFDHANTKSSYGYDTNDLPKDPP